MATGYSPASTGVDGTSTAYSYPSQYSDGQHQQHQQQYNSGLMATSDYQQSGLMATTDYPDATAAAKAEAIQDHHQQHQSHAGYPQDSHSPPPATLTSSEGRICGLRKTTFWLIVLSAVLAAGLIGAAVAAGILASQNSNGNGSAGSGAATTASGPATATTAAVSASASESAATTRSATSTASATDFTAIPIPTQASSGLGVTDPGCPGVNGTEYTVPGTDLVFERLCGVNFAGNDIGHIPMTRMEDCLMLCASQYISPQGAAGSCLGVVWGYGGRQGTNAAYCWLKFSKTIREDVADTETAWLIPK
ncbi:hypothetical protein HYQ45_002462 [Verticillium longisporum]|uniref:Apple domain-containing protein n=3 Tax=Verticillium TaxID=1036719 RepID=G2X8U2_VERDV|nr:uncharacterized protein VDAG_06233 [Verticillium dahliae VdLs.17]KAF3342204.1 Reticulocyte-binding protein 2-like protein a [Verticillium dahliae VDG2]KAF3359093.1 hypothetical protein VdG1_02655 [Verticillium dahliae VDG1]KAG7140745.1 hypothetical protein HYQ45_002462 [Verticillium longisporum]KAH6698032.1 hypothetical protein EV126DRAFT_64536 [Verticillium dahliae]EGY15379.1 hypothetical protein VDAG_06233 [Verticillium dahliae VdLs.17]